MTAISTLSQNWDSAAVLFAAKRAPGMAKQTLDDNPITESLTQKEITSQMGLRIEVPLEIGRNPNAGYLASFDSQVEIIPTEVAAMAVYKPSLLMCPVRFNLNEKRLSTSPEAFGNLLVMRENQARRTLAEILNFKLYGTGANLTTLGLGAYIPTTVGSNTVGTISETNAPFWKSQVRTGAGSFAANMHNGTANDYMLDMWITTSSSSNGAKGHADLLVAHPDVYQGYSRSESSKIRITSNSPGLGGIYENQMSYRGVPIVFDKMADAGTIYYLHKSAFSWYVAPGMNMDVSPMMGVNGMPYVSYYVLTLFHQLVCDHRQLLGKITGITVP